VRDAEACARACDEAWNSACKAFAVSGSRCWLKYGVNPSATVSANTDWYEQLTPRAYACPGGETCGESVAGHLYVQKGTTTFDNGNNVLSVGGTMSHVSSEEVCFKYFEDSTAAAKVGVVYIPDPTPASSTSVGQCKIMTVSLASQPAADATTETAQHLWYEPYQPTAPTSIRCAADDAPGTCVLDPTDQLHPKSWLAAGTGSTPTYTQQADFPTLTFVNGEDNGVAITRALNDKHSAWDCQLHRNDEHKATEPAPAEQLHTSVSHIYHELE